MSRKSPSVWEGAIAGAAGGMAAAIVTQPIELIKVRLQLAGESLKMSSMTSLGRGSALPLSSDPAGHIQRSSHDPPMLRAAEKVRRTVQLVRSIATNDGIINGFYRGLSASLARQAVYSTTRFGVYAQLKDWASTRFDIGASRGSAQSKLPISALLPISMAAGAAGAVISCPTDLVLVRMQSDGRLEPSQRRNYRNVFDGIARITREEGIAALWRGSVPNVNRAMVVAAGQLCTYDACKSWLTLERSSSFGQGFASSEKQRSLLNDGLFAHIVASLMSGVVTCVAASPVDVIRTRVMAAKLSAAGGVQYSGSFDCLKHILGTEGIRGLYRGLGAYYAKVGPYCVTIFVCYEQVHGMLRRMRD